MFSSLSIQSAFCIHSVYILCFDIVSSYTKSLFMLQDKSASLSICVQFILMERRLKRGVKYHCIPMGLYAVHLFSSHKTNLPVHVFATHSSIPHFLPCLSPISFLEKGMFILESEPLKRCITVDRSNLVLEDCERPTRRMLWKWVSRHRLFNLGTSMCLGLNISDTTQPLGMFECDMILPVLWWRCSGNTLYGASQWKVAVAGRLVIVKKNSYHEWKRYNTPRGGPCSYPYEGKHKISCRFSALNVTSHW